MPRGIFASAAERLVGCRKRKSNLRKTRSDPCICLSRASGTRVVRVQNLEFQTNCKPTARNWTIEYSYMPSMMLMVFSGEPWFSNVTNLVISSQFHDHFITSSEYFLDGLELSTSTFRTVYMTESKKIIFVNMDTTYPIIIGLFWRRSPGVSCKKGLVSCKVWSTPHLVPMYCNGLNKLTYNRTTMACWKMWYDVLWLVLRK